MRVANTSITLVLILFAFSESTSAGHFSVTPKFTQEIQYDASGNVLSFKTQQTNPPVNQVNIEITPTEIRAVGDAVAKVYEVIAAVIRDLIQGTVFKEMLGLDDSQLNPFTIPTRSDTHTPLDVSLQNANQLNLDLSAYGYEGVAGGIIYTPDSPITSPMSFGPVNFTLNNSFGPNGFPLPPNSVITGFEYIIVTQGTDGSIDVAPGVFAAVPEPSSLALLALGGACLLGCGWRRRRG